MWDNKEQRIDDRIVSINQPHVRSIVRGKAGKNTEFGDKLSASCIDGYVFLHRISWDNYNESGDLEAQVEEFKITQVIIQSRFMALQIYRTRENRKFCKEKGIRISGPPVC